MDHSFLIFLLFSSILLFVPIISSNKLVYGTSPLWVKNCTIWVLDYCLEGDWHVMADVSKAWLYSDFPYTSKEVNMSAFGQH